MIKDKKRLFYFVIIGACFIETILPIMSKIVGRFSKYYAFYFTSHYWDISVKGALLFILFIVASLIYVCFCKMDKKQEDYILMSCIVLFLALEILGWRYTMLQRLAWYFRVMLIIYLPRIYDFCNKRNYIVYMFILNALLFGSYFSYANSSSRIYSLIF